MRVRDRESEKNIYRDHPFCLYLDRRVLQPKNPSATGRYLCDRPTEAYERKISGYKLAPNVGHIAVDKEIFVKGEAGSEKRARYEPCAARSRNPVARRDVST